MIQIVDVKSLLTSLESIAALKKQVFIAFEGREMRISTVDDQHVMLIHFVYTHTTHGIKKQLFKVDLKTLCNIIKMCNKLGTIHIKIHDHSNSFDIIAEQSSFTVPCMPSSAEEHNEYDPGVSSNACICIQMHAKEAKTLFKELMSFGGDIEFQLDNIKGKNHITSEGKGGAARIDLNSGCAAVNKVTFNEIEILNQKFDAKYLSKLTSKLDTISKTVTFTMVDGMPMEIKYNLSGEKSVLSFYLAPKQS